MGNKQAQQAARTQYPSVPPAVWDRAERFLNRVQTTEPEERLPDGQQLFIHISAPVSSGKKRATGRRERIWFSYNPATAQWSWSLDKLNWMPTSITFVTAGQLMGSQPAIENQVILQTLGQRRPIPGNNEYVVQGSVVLICSQGKHGQSMPAKAQPKDKALGAFLPQAFEDRVVVQNAVAQCPLLEMHSTHVDDPPHSSSWYLRYLEDFLSQMATQGRPAVIWYTGHGKNPTGDWCFVDGYITLKDILDLYERTFQGNILHIVSDCCYSGKWVDQISRCKEKYKIWLMASSGPHEAAHDGHFTAHGVKVENYRLVFKYQLPNTRQHPCSWSWIAGRVPEKSADTVINTAKQQQATPRVPTVDAMDIQPDPSEKSYGSYHSYGTQAPAGYYGGGVAATRCQTPPTSRRSLTPRRGLGIHRSHSSSQLQSYSRHHDQQGYNAPPPSYQQQQTYQQTPVVDPTPIVTPTNRNITPQRSLTPTRKAPTTAGYQQVAPTVYSSHSGYTQHVNPNAYTVDVGGVEMAWLNQYTPDMYGYNQVTAAAPALSSAGGLSMMNNYVPSMYSSYGW